MKKVGIAVCKIAFPGRKSQGLIFIEDYNILVMNFFPQIQLKRFIFLIFLFITLQGCQPSTIKGSSEVIPSTIPQSETATLLPQVTLTTTMPTAALLPAVWIDPATPIEIQSEIRKMNDFQLVSNFADSTYQIGPVKPGTSAEILQTIFFALAAPFPTIQDDIDFQQLSARLAGDDQNSSVPVRIMIDPGDKNVIQSGSGIALNEKSILITESSRQLEIGWKDHSIWALIPFDQLSPRWKVITIDQNDILSKTFHPEKYPLKAEIGVYSDKGGVDLSVISGILRSKIAASNRDPGKLTIVDVTGTTALVRYTAQRMEQKGIDYPAQDILPFFKQADILHISNEVAFAEDCPPGNPVRLSIRFCSRPEYLQLLKTIGTTIIELTGNHEMDWSADAFLNTLNIYQQNGILTYGGGKNTLDASQPVLISHNGNRFAFLGCNAVGPENDWATDKQPGALRCNWEDLTTKIGELKRQGYLVIVTLQHYEACQMKPHSWEVEDFGLVASAEPTIISGSQAHCPQGAAFIGNTYVHYGLGNLFFDQMEAVNRRGTIDQHFFYNGKYLSVRWETTYLEDYARPRPMTEEERQAFLKELFLASGW